MKQKSISLTAKFFILLIIFTVIPMNLILFFMKSGFEKYIISEINSRTVTTLTKSEEDLYDTFDRLSNMSSVIASNEGLIDVLQGDSSYFEKYKIFDSVIYQLMLNNLFKENEVQITIIGQDGNIYTNWERNYQDYSFLEEKEFVKNSKKGKGYVEWAIFSDAFIMEDSENEKYLGLARSILNDIVSGDYVGTLIISIRQDEISEVLEKYVNIGDSVFVCDEDGQIILRKDYENRIFSEGESVIPETYFQDARENKVVQVEGRKYLLCNYGINKKWTMNGKQLNVIYFTDYQEVTSQFYAFSKQMNLLIIVAFSALIALIFFLSLWLVRPIKLLAKQLNEYDMNLDLDRKLLDVNRKDEIGDLNRSFYQMNENIKELFEQVRDEQERKEQYRIEFLKAQLNPHFLFNTLGTIRWMAIIRKADNIVETIDALGNMLKYSMGKGEELVTLEEEIENLKGYVKIQNMRYGNICEVSIAIPEELMHEKIIRFIMQPLVENAIVHGFEDNKTENRLSISAQKERIDDQESVKEKLCIRIEDNGKGISDEELILLNSKKQIADITEEKLEKRKFNKIGVINVEEQIKIRFGDAYGLKFEHGTKGGTCVKIELPIIKKD